MPEPASTQKSGNGTNLVPVLVAVATAIGTLGWVAFIGGAILWISFSRANLPAAEAVARVPTGVLVATGAEFVVWAALAALVMIVVSLVVLYLFDDRVQSIRLMHRAYAAPVASPTPDLKEPIVLGLLPGALLAGTAVGFAFAVDLGYGHVPWPWGVVVVCAAGVAAGFVGAILYSTTAKFSVIGVFALVAVPLVMAIATYYRAQAAPRVEPVALLRSDGSPFVGFFIAQTTDRVYVGTFDEQTPDPCTLLHRGCKSQIARVTVPARLLSLPVDDVQNLTVGPRTPLYAEDALTDRTRPRTAREWAAGAALRLCKTANSARKRAAAANALAGRGGAQAILPPTCSDGDVAYLRNFAQQERSVVNELSSSG
jgi:hypothetical protein